ncbi:MAG: hypothetical protein K0B14_10365 [Anaerolineaceae bacterium]|nr:hypothetical protein [Anaerolineaceae bacterium]
MELSINSAQEKMWKLALGFANTAVIYALIKSEVVEELRFDAKTLDELVYACGLNPDVLFRTLRFAEVIEVITLQDGKYALSDVGKLLLKDVPGSLYYGLLLAGSDPWQQAWHNLTYSLTIGENAFEAAMGTPFYDYMNRFQQYGNPYNQWMTISTKMSANSIVEAYDFSTIMSVCDIGGGQGVLLQTLLEENPHLQGILFDQSSVLETHILADLSDRVKVEAGNFFEKVPAADLMILKSVLHNWEDEKALMILNNCREVMSPSSRLLIIEMIIDSPTDQIGAFYDLNMQVLFNGKERTEEEFDGLLKQANLQIKRIIPTKSLVKIIEVILK